MPRFIYMVRPLLGLMPEVSQPDRRLPINEKLAWTVFALMMYLFASGVPLYGMQTTRTSDPFHWLRVILASNRGTLMELGLAPIMTSSLVMQLMQGAGLLQVNMGSREERALFAGAQKLVGFGVTLAEAVAYVFCGMYGDVATLGYGTCALLAAQLCLAGLLVILLDELLQKGYGLGSGLSLFMAVNTCTDILWSTVAPVSVTTGRGTEYHGCLVAFVHLLVSRKDKLRALADAFTRPHMPNLLNLAGTLAIMGAVTWFQGWRVNIPVKSVKHRTQSGQYPVKLFYTGNMPVVLYAAMVGQLYFVSQLVYAKMGSIPLVRLLGVWEEYGDGAGSKPVSGLAYLLSPPATLWELAADPLRALFYLSFVLSSCAMLSKAWMETTGQGPREVAEQLRNEQVAVKGHRDHAIAVVLQRYIPSAAALGGLTVGGLAVGADYLGALGSGTGIMLAVTTIFQYYEIFMREQKELMGSLGLLGQQ
mmetsp:Transcript_16101/g.30342  ORF Transcript_16101/g.30342 Transcript_16101/m.30342 type:complete len:477 (-) Transcript_16101:243-1673(-)